LVFDCVLDASGCNSTIRERACDEGSSIRQTPTEAGVESPDPSYRFRVLRLHGVPETITVAGVEFSDIQKFLPFIKKPLDCRLHFSGIPGEFFLVITQFENGPEWETDSFDELVQLFKAKAPELAQYLDPDQKESPRGETKIVLYSNLSIKNHRVVFVGDSAKVTRPTLARGINSALLESLVFVDEVVAADGDYAAAAKAYDDAMLPECRAVVLVSEATALMFHKPAFAGLVRQLGAATAPVAGIFAAMSGGLPDATDPNVRNFFATFMHVRSAENNAAEKMVAALKALKQSHTCSQEREFDIAAEQHRESIAEIIFQLVTGAASAKVELRYGAFESDEDLRGNVMRKEWVLDTFLDKIMPVMQGYVQNL
jgi:hypothetical protein